MEICELHERQNLNLALCGGLNTVIQFILKVILPCSQLASDLACPLFDTVAVVAARRSSRVGRLAP